MTGYNDNEMAKDPAFLFFPGDWLGGTMTFSRSHKGAYMDLLMCQFNQGHMTLQDIQVVLGDADFASMWEIKLKTKFIQDSDGLFYNQKLEEEVFKRKKFTQSRRDNLSGISHIGDHMNNHMGGDMGTQVGDHMENRNENRNENKKKRNKKEGVQPHHFHESQYFDKEILIHALTGTKYQDADIEFYHSAADNWSRSKTANKKSDWLATVKNFMLRDIGDGKFKTKNYQKNGINGTHQQPVSGNGQKLGTSDARTEATKNW